MRYLLELGRLESLESAAGEFADCVDAQKFFEPEAFTAWGRRILVDHPGKQALIVPAGTVIDGDLCLDEIEGEPDLPAIGTVLALGDLTITGRLVNDSPDSGAFLLVGGNLLAGEIFKGASNVVVLGSLVSEATIFCDFCPGSLVTGRDLSAPLIISNDHEISVGGTLAGLLISSEQGNMRESLVPGVFSDPDDLDDEWPDGALIRERMDAGLPLLKSE